MFKRLLKKNKAIYIFLREWTMKCRKLRYGWTGISSKSWVSSRQNYFSKDLVLGDYGFIAQNCTIYPNVKIGRFLLMAPDVCIFGADHEFRTVGTPICFSGRESLPSTRIGDDVWIGMSAKIMVGVSIGDGAIIATGAIVTTDVPPFAIVGGIPARILRYRFDNDMERAEHIKRLSEISTYGNLVGDLL
jgi:acetyltransferase-like isoleucine patch superfamily enzyme